MNQKLINHIHDSLKLWIKNNDNLANITMFEYTNNLVEKMNYLVIQVKSQNLDTYVISYNKIFVSDDILKINYSVNYGSKIIKFIIMLK